MGDGGPNCKWPPVSAVPHTTHDTLGFSSTFQVSISTQHVDIWMLHFGKDIHGRHQNEQQTGRVEATTVAVHYRSWLSFSFSLAHTLSFSLSLCHSCLSVSHITQGMGTQWCLVCVLTLLIIKMSLGFSSVVILLHSVINTNYNNKNRLPCSVSRQASKSHFKTWWLVLLK